MGSLIELARKLRPKIEELAQNISDTEALEFKALYPLWAAGTAYAISHKVRYKDRLYRVLQAHTAQVGWEPTVVPALYEVINEVNTGTLDDPIPYGGNMALEHGKYYTQNGVTYLCIRDTGVPVYHDLSALVGLYVEVV